MGDSDDELPADVSDLGFYAQEATQTPVKRQRVAKAPGQVAKAAASALVSRKLLQMKFGVKYLFCSPGLKIPIYQLGILAQPMYVYLLAQVEELVAGDEVEAVAGDVVEVEVLDLEVVLLDKQVHNRRPLATVTL